MIGAFDPDNVVRRASIPIQLTLPPAKLNHGFCIELIDLLQDRRRNPHGESHLAGSVGRLALGGPVDEDLGAAIGGGDEVPRPLDRDLQVLDLAEVAAQAARG